MTKQVIRGAQLDSMSLRMLAGVACNYGTISEYARCRRACPVPAPATLRPAGFRGDTGREIERVSFLTTAMHARRGFL
jgi:hypothetical protein